MSSNFRLNIDGLHCETVSRIEAITVTQLLDPERRDPNSQLFPSVSNLVITLRDDSNATDFYDWHRSFVIEGNNSQNQEKNGTLELLSANLQDVLFTLQFNNLGIFRLAPIQASADAIPGFKPKCTATRYCSLPAAARWPAQLPSPESQLAARLELQLAANSAYSAHMEASLVSQLPECKFRPRRRQEPYYPSQDCQIRFQRAV